MERRERRYENVVPAAPLTCGLFYPSYLVKHPTFRRALPPSASSHIAACRNLTFSVHEPLSVRACVHEACGLPADRILLCQMSHFQKGFAPHGENEVNTFLFALSLPLPPLLPPSPCPSITLLLLLLRLPHHPLSPPLTYPFLSSFPLP